MPKASSFFASETRKSHRPAAATRPAWLQAAIQCASGPRLTPKQRAAGARRSSSRIGSEEPHGRLTFSSSLRKPPQRRVAGYRRFCSRSRIRPKDARSGRARTPREACTRRHSPRCNPHRSRSKSGFAAKRNRHRHPHKMKNSSAPQVGTAHDHVSRGNGIFHRISANTAKPLPMPKRTPTSQGASKL